LAVTINQSDALIRLPDINHHAALSIFLAKVLLSLRFSRRLLQALPSRLGEAGNMTTTEQKYPHPG
jgi:hypothetical protein